MLGKKARQEGIEMNSLLSIFSKLLVFSRSNVVLLKKHLAPPNQVLKMLTPTGPTDTFHTGSACRFLYIPEL